MSWEEEYFEATLVALSYIEKNLEEDIGVKDVTATAPLSHWQFQRVFKCVVGESIGQYLRQRRLSEAMKSLRESDLRIIDVAFQYQFNSQEAFARSFKQMFGVAPKEARADAAGVHPLKPKLDREKIKFFWKNIWREPEIVELPVIYLRGREVSIHSPFTEESDFPEILPGHWAGFLKELSSRVKEMPEQYYGVAQSPSGDFSEPMVQYFSGCENLEAGEGFEKMQIEAGKWARFENVGLSQGTYSTMDYIYGIWLPNSEYKRRDGSDFEIFDERYHGHDEQSVSTYYLPVD